MRAQRRAGKPHLSRNKSKTEHSLRRAIASSVAFGPCVLTCNDSVLRLHWLSSAIGQDNRDQFFNRLMAGLLSGLLELPAATNAGCAPPAVCAAGYNPPASDPRP